MGKMSINKILYASLLWIPFQICNTQKMYYLYEGEIIREYSIFSTHTPVSLPWDNQGFFCCLPYPTYLSK